MSKVFTVIDTLSAVVAGSIMICHIHGMTPSSPDANLVAYRSCQDQTRETARYQRNHFILEAVMMYLMKQSLKLVAKALPVGVHLGGGALAGHHQLSHHLKHLCTTFPSTPVISPTSTPIPMPYMHNPNPNPCSMVPTNCPPSPFIICHAYPMLPVRPMMLT